MINTQLKIKMIKIILTTASLILLFGLTTNAHSKEKEFPKFSFDPSSLTEAAPIKTECRHLALDKTRKQQTIAEVPVDAMQANVAGYAVFDFQIDGTGSVVNIELASLDSKKYFVLNAKQTLRKLKFAVDSEWLQNCADQKYRIGYAFRIMEACTYKEFPAPIISMCSQAVIDSKIVTQTINL